MIIRRRTNINGQEYQEKRDAVEMYREIDRNSTYFSLSYWLFIVASCGIATMGLIINSPAVIIGAMLVSPLMSPIIGLGMGIAVALMPPVCVVGFGLGAGMHWKMMWGALPG